MIWYDKEFQLEGQPSNVDIRMVGSYNPDRAPLILLCLSVDSKDISLFDHNPAMMRREDPDPDDVLAKYNHKVRKYESLIASMNYSDFTVWANRKNTV